MAEEATNPDAEEEITSDATGVAEEAQAQGDQTDGDDTETDAEAEASAEADDDTEEIDHDGERYRVPKALKDAFLRQADYTRKTQEVAETRKALEAWQGQVEQQAKAVAETMDQRVKLAMVTTQIDQMADIDWGQYAQTYGADRAVAAMAQVQTLRDQRTTLEREIQAKESELTSNAIAREEAVLREAEQTLAREIQGFGPQLITDVGRTALALGFSAEEVKASFLSDDGTPDTRTFKALARLAKAEARVAELEAKQTKAQTAEKVAKVQPAKTVSANAGQYKAGLNDDLPVDEWLRRRNAELAKAGRR